MCDIFTRPKVKIHDIYINCREKGSQMINKDGKNRDLNLNQNLKMQLIKHSNHRILLLKCSQFKKKKSCLQLRGSIWARSTPAPKN
jgi:hypothetical protein